ncbi:MAG: hypothetical protein F4187_08930 [Gemmatimonadetes bacterium]|nr:hypothetical protein [Gemmatimonadota bacterium]MYI06257.1 hypothetical protein [Gemmatimonadota bacterium]
MKRVAVVLLALCLVVVAYSCRDAVEPPPPPVDPSGFLRVSVTTDHADLGALVVRIWGAPAADSIRAAPGLTVYHGAAPSSVRVFVAGPIPASGPILRFWTPDASVISDYQVTVEDAAATSYEQRPVAEVRTSITR